MLRTLTSADLFELLATQYPPPIDRLREQVTLQELQSIPSTLEKYKRLRTVSLYIHCVAY